MNKSFNYFRFLPAEYFGYIFLIPLVLQLLFEAEIIGSMIWIKNYFIQMFLWWFMLSLATFLFVPKKDHRYKSVINMSYPAVILLATVIFCTPLGFVVAWYVYGQPNQLLWITIPISLLGFGILIPYFVLAIPWIHHRKITIINRINLLS